MKLLLIRIAQIKIIYAHLKGCAFIYEEMLVSKLFSRVCIGGASLNCINFVVPLNIATTKLIQCGRAEKPENKAFYGFCGFVFLLFEPFFC